MATKASSDGHIRLRWRDIHGLDLSLSARARAVRLRAQLTDSPRATRHHVSGRWAITNVVFITSYSTYPSIVYRYRPAEKGNLGGLMTNMVGVGEIYDPKRERERVHKIRKRLRPATGVDLGVLCIWHLRRQANRETRRERDR